MLESKSWHSKTETKMWKVQRWWYLSKLVTNTLTNFLLIIFLLSQSFHILSPLSAAGNIFSRNTAWGNWVMSFCLEIDDKNLGESFTWGHELNWKDSIFWLTNVFFCNLNTVNLKQFSQPCWEIKVWKAIQ